MSGWTHRLLAAGELLPGSLVIAKDAPGRYRPSKRFMRLGTWDGYERALLESREKHLYEVIPDGVFTPVWFFADHDCYSADAGGMREGEFARAVCALYFDYFGLSADDVGHRMFVSSTCRTEKLSVHVKVNLRTCMIEAGEHARAASASCSDPRIRPDMSVYRRGPQQIRCIGAAKLGCSRAKTPIIEPASVRRYLHLVRLRPGHSQVCLDGAPKVGPAPAGRETPRTSPADASDVAGIRKAIAGSDVRHALGPAFCPDTCYIDSPRKNEERRMLVCYVDGTARRGSTLVCPFARRAHKGNRALIKFFHAGGGRGHLEFSCCDADCAGTLVFAYNV